MSAVRSGQRPVLAWNDPFDVFGDQRQQSLPVTAADRGEEVLHGLDVLLNAHGNFFLRSVLILFPRPFRWPRSRHRPTTPAHSRSWNRLKQETAQPPQFLPDAPSFPAGSGIRTSASPLR